MTFDNLFEERFVNCFASAVLCRLIRATHLSNAVTQIRVLRESEFSVFSEMTCLGPGNRSDATCLFVSLEVCIAKVKKEFRATGKTKNGGKGKGRNCVFMQRARSCFWKYIRVGQTRRAFRASGVANTRENAREKSNYDKHAYARNIKNIYDERRVYEVPNVLVPKGFYRHRVFATKYGGAD